MKKSKFFSMFIVALLAATMVFAGLAFAGCGEEENQGGGGNGDQPPVVVTLSKITVTTNPTKTEYTVGETFDPSGIAVTATYSDNSTKAVAAGNLKYSVTAPLTEEDTSVDISYTDGGVTKSTSLIISVVDPREQYEFSFHNAVYEGCSPASDEDALSTFKKTGATITYYVNMPTAGRVSLYFVGAIPLNLGYSFDQVWTVEIDGEWMESTADVAYATSDPSWHNLTKLYLGDLDFTAGDHTVKLTVPDFQDGGMCNFYGIMFKSEQPVRQAKAQKAFGRDDAILAGGATPEAANEAIGGLNGNVNAKITYKLNVSGEVDATVKADLYVTTAIADNSAAFADVLTVTLNGEAVDTSAAVWHTDAAPGWATFEKILIGEVALRAGEVNTIEIGVPAEAPAGGDHRGQTCFMNVVLATNDADITSAKLTETTFACTDAELSGGARLEGDNLDYVGGLYKVADAKITYRLSVSGTDGATVEANLYVTTGVADLAATFGGVLTVTVNGVRQDGAGAEWQTTGTPNWQTFEKLFVCKVTLNAGAVNTVEIGVPPEAEVDSENDHRGQTCFKSITLATDDATITKAA